MFSQRGGWCPHLCGPPLASPISLWGLSCFLHFDFFYKSQILLHFPLQKYSKKSQKNATFLLFFFLFSSFSTFSLHFPLLSTPPSGFHVLNFKIPSRTLKNHFSSTFSSFFASFFSLFLVDLTFIFRSNSVNFYYFLNPIDFPESSCFEKPCPMSTVRVFYVCPEPRTIVQLNVRFFHHDFL